MIMTIRSLLISVLLGLLVAPLGAQDFHLSQHREATLYYNPALTGTYTGINADEEADYRIAMDARSQWRSLGLDPYNTAYLAYDQKYERFGLGAYLINNSSGNGNLNVLQFQLSGNYNITERDAPHILTAGLQMGMIHKSFDPGGFTYESQYSVAAGGFDQTLASGENFSQTSRFNFDANLGLFYKYNDRSKTAQPYIGIAAHHLTRPDESFFSGSKRLPIRWVGRAGTDLEVEEDRFYIQPDLLYMYQAKAQEIHMGANFRYDMDDPYSLIGGVGYRYQDAVTVQLGFMYKRNRIEFGYDINTSNLQPYTMGRGAMELSLVLLGKKGEPLFHPKFF